MYLSGVKHAAIADELASGQIGFLTTPNIGNSLDGVKVWAADSGCFAAANYVGNDAYIGWLAKNAPRLSSFLFATVPVVVGDGAATLALFPTLAPRIRALGYPVALVGQDGMEDMAVPWDQFDWLFIGGSTEWKMGAGAEALIRQAQQRGKRVHVGRVNSDSRFAWFRSLGCDTADGTFLAFGPDVNARKLRRWIRRPKQLLIGGEA